MFLNCERTSVLSDSLPCDSMMIPNGYKKGKTMNLNDKMNDILKIVKTMDNNEILQLEKCILDVWLNNLQKYDVESNTKKKEKIC